MLYDNAKYQDFVRAALSQARPAHCPAIVVHGGAWSVRATRNNDGDDATVEAGRVHAAEAAARMGYEVLRRGGASIDAVEAALASLEDCPTFLTGSLSGCESSETEAFVMEGLLCNSGAVMAMQKRPSRPFCAARAVMEKTHHIMLCGQPALTFASQQTQDESAIVNLVTKFTAVSASSDGTWNSKGGSCRDHDSVGAVAIDSKGHIVCGTWSRGCSGKLAGSVSAATIVGGGAYCANESGGALVVGGGQAADDSAVAKLCLAHDICRYMKAGSDAQTSTEKALAVLHRRLDARGAAIAIDASGRIGLHFTADRLAWASVDRDGQAKSGCRPDRKVSPAVSCPEQPVAPIAENAHPLLPLIIVHGGAGVWDVVLGAATAGHLETEAYYSGVKAAAKAGYAKLRSGDHALDAAVAAVLLLEDNPLFNAGHGSRYTIDHTVEMDAVIMDGCDLSGAGTSCVTNVRNPVLLVDALRTKTNCALLVSKGAVAFAENNGLRMELDDYFESETSENIFRKDCVAHGIVYPPDETPAAVDDTSPKPTTETLSVVAGAPVATTQQPRACLKCNDTVGAVVIDSHGNVAVATSTGGRSYKMRGRVGDSPIIGAGGYADNEVGAVSTTGLGEIIARAVLGKVILDKMREGLSAQAAADGAIAEATERLGPSMMGAIVVGSRGDVGVAFNSQGMAWAMVRDDTVTYGLRHEDAFPPETLVA